MMTNTILIIASVVGLVVLVLVIKSHFAKQELIHKQSKMKKNANQGKEFSIPFKLCWSDLKTVCIVAFKEPIKTDSSSCDIDSSTKLILKNKITQLVNKVLHYTKENDQFTFLPQQMRTGFEL